MKKSFLLALALLVTIPAYMAFIISRSEKDPENLVQRYHYPGLSSLSVPMAINVWVAQNDSNYMECKGCDTTGMFEAQTLNLGKDAPSSYLFYELQERWHYKVDLKEIASVKSELNAFYITGLRQKKLQLELGFHSKIGLENCELDTLFINTVESGIQELYFESGCRIKHIIVTGAKGTISSLKFSVASGVDIENLVATGVDESGFELNFPAEILTKMNFKLNGRQVTTADTITTKPKSTK
jgi:hypothetical protein